jgi:hypothetical protein
VPHRECFIAHPNKVRTRSKVDRPCASATPNAKHTFAASVGHTDGKGEPPISPIFNVRRAECPPRESSSAVDVRSQAGVHGRGRGRGRGGGDGRGGGGGDWDRRGRGDNGRTRDRGDKHKKEDSDSLHLWDEWYSVGEMEMDEGESCGGKKNP